MTRLVTMTVSVGLDPATTLYTTVPTSATRRMTSDVGRNTARCRTRPHSGPCNRSFPNLARQPVDNGSYPHNLAIVEVEEDIK